MPDAIAIETALEIVVPVAAGVAVIRLAGTRPSLRASPARTVLVLFVLLLIAAALLSPGGDLVTPTIGLIVSAVVCAVLYIDIRRRQDEPT